MIEIRVLRTTTGSFVGVFAGTNLPRGSVVCDLTLGEFIPDRNFRTIEINSGHVDHPVGRYVNHSCNPTAFVDREQSALVSARDLSEGEQITFDYNSNEKNIATPFQCSCGAVSCRGRIC